MNPSLGRHSFTLQSGNRDAKLDNYLQVFSFCVISTGEVDQLDLCCYRTHYTGGANHFIFFLPPAPEEFFEAIQHPFTVRRHLTVN